MTVVVLIVAVIAAFISGYFLGREQTLSSLNKRIEESYQRGRAEVEMEKQKLAGEIRDRLVDLKGSLKSTVAAYESTTRVLRSAMSISTESRDLGADLALDFFTDVEPTQPQLGDVPKSE